MTQRGNHYQAVKDASYPTIPSNYPNRFVRRAIAYRSGRLPKVWAIYHQQVQAKMAERFLKKPIIDGVPND